MARQPLPRYRADLVVTVELAAEDEDDAARRLNLLLDDTLRDSVAATVRNYGGRTARLVAAYPLDPSQV